jgi:hypothetical protein
MARVVSALFFAGAAMVLGREVARVWRPSVRSSSPTPTWREGSTWEDPPEDER